jgi:hypothetical protein
MIGAEAIAICAAVSETFGTFRGAARVERLAREEWASVTFSGARHRLGLTFEGAGAVGFAADLLERLPDLELAVPGCILADIALLAEARRDDGCYAYLELEALTIDD